MYMKTKKMRKNNKKITLPWIYKINNNLVIQLIERIIFNNKNKKINFKIFLLIINTQQ